MFVGRYAYLNDRPAKGRDPVSGIDTTEKAINKDDKSDTITCSTVSSATQSTASRRGSSDEDAPTLTDATSVDGSSHDEPSTNKASTTIVAHPKEEVKSPAKKKIRIKVWTPTSRARQVRFNDWKRKATASHVLSLQLRYCASIFTDEDIKNITEAAPDVDDLKKFRDEHLLRKCSPR